MTVFRDVAKRYLGDAVYAECRDGMIVLTVEYGFGPEGREIFLEPAVWLELQELVGQAEGRLEGGEDDGQRPG